MAAAAPVPTRRQQHVHIHLAHEHIDGGHIRRLAEWTDRIKAGELPASTPSRPQGAERNLVVTVYDWLSPKYYVHDLTLTDRRKPTVNRYGRIYGAAELSTDELPILDPLRITKST